MIGLYHYIAIAMFAAFAAADALVGARRYPTVGWWRTRGIVSMIVYFAAATYCPLLWDETLGRYQLVDGSALPFWAQVAAGFLLIEGMIYAWHRTMHRVPQIWRWFHQMHHSPERMDIWGAFYFHPFDSIGWALLGSLALVLGIGLTAEAAIVVNVAATFLAMFQHLNIRTPRWLGYIVQRPESHSIHHQRGVHAGNYGDLPLYDLLFGTFRNPAEPATEAGFFEGSTDRTGALLAGKVIA